MLYSIIYVNELQGFYKIDLKMSLLKGENLKVEWLNWVIIREQYWDSSSSSFILMTSNLNSPVLFAFLLMLMHITYKYIMSDSIILQDVFRLQKWENTWQRAFNVNKCKLLCITYRK